MKSFILFLDTTLDNVPEGLLRRNTPIRSLPSLLEGYDNDYTRIYQKLSNGAISDDALFEQLIKVYRNFVNSQRVMTVNSYPYDVLEKAKQQLYMLYLTGFIDDWYSYAQSKDKSGTDILVDICSTNADSYKADPSKMLNRMKGRMHSYFVYMGNSREAIAKVERSKSPEEIIRVYVKWYYERYLYHHNEQFLDFFEFVTTNSKCDHDKITEEIKDYFVLPFAKLKSDEALYNELSIKEIIAKTTEGVSKNTLVNLERINSTRYSYKLDAALFCGQLRMNDVFDENRLDRILSKLPEDEIGLLKNAVISLYSSCSTEAKIAILNYMEHSAASLKTTFHDFLEMIFKDGAKDEVYYGIMARMLNKQFAKIRRVDYV